MAGRPQDGRSIGHADDYTSGMDVHYSSGVYNKAFYLLANKSGWNTQEAFQAFARANRHYWPASTALAQGPCGVQQPAPDPGFTDHRVEAAVPSLAENCARIRTT